jgi:hypothetical protein
MWKEVVITKFEVLSQNWPRGIEENLGKPQSEQSVSQSRFDYVTSRTQVRSVLAPANLLGGITSYIH